jgi:hypothetical protein
MGYAVGISDIRVTFSDGSERDCLHLTYAQNPPYLRPPAEFSSSSFLLDRVWKAR